MKYLKQYGVLLICLLFTQTVWAVDDFSKLFEQTSPSVYTIIIYNKYGEQLGQGSGFLVNDNGTVATNWHVVSAGSIAVLKMQDETELAASCILTADEDWDVALLQFEELKQKPLKMAADGSAKVGMPVLAIGSPLGLDQTLSVGIVSGLREKDEHKDLLQVTCAISPGSSGGPVMNVDGEVMGLAQSTRHGGQNINFAVPVRVVRELLADAEPEAPLRNLSKLDETVKKAIADARALRDKLEQKIEKEDMDLIDTCIAEAIQIGAPIYNAAGQAGHLACFRIYEGAAYKMLLKLEDRAPSASKTLKKALEDCDKTQSFTQKAWIMRRCFDKISGERTQGGDGIAEPTE